MSSEYGSHHGTLETLYIYWPCVMAAFVILIGCVYDAKRADQLWPVPINIEQAPDLLCSPILHVSMIASGIGLTIAHRASKSFVKEFTATEKMCMTWHLMNATFYHTFCDVCSGLFAITPNMREAYHVQNYDHKLPRHHPDRVSWDAIYWFELLVETPFALWVFYLYVTQSRLRYTVEAFLHGMHFGGFFAYYIPDIILGHTPHVLISNIDRAIACAWVIVPFLLLARTIKKIRDNEDIQGVPLCGYKEPGINRKKMK